MTAERQKKLGKSAESDDQEEKDPEEKKADIAGELEDPSIGKSEEEASKQAEEIVASGSKFVFEVATLMPQLIFDVVSKGGVLIIKLNTAHPAYEHLVGLLDDDAEELIALKILLGAWARLEDEGSPEEREKLQGLRFDWGRISMDYLKGLDD